MRSAEFLVSLGLQIGQDEVAVVVEDNKVPTHLHQESGGRVRLLAGGRRERLPELLSIVRPQTAKQPSKRLLGQDGCQMGFGSQK